MSQVNQWRWWTIALRGLAALLLGIAALVAPGLAFVSLVILFGAYAIVDGVLAFGLASRGSGRVHAAMLARAAVSVGAGALALLLPGLTALGLLLMIAAWAVLSGLLELALVIRLRRARREEWLLALEGALSIAFGVLLFLSPLVGAVVLGLWVGAYALILGGMLLSSSLRVRRYLRATGRSGSVIQPLQLPG